MGDEVQLVRLCNSGNSFSEELNGPKITNKNISDSTTCTFLVTPKRMYVFVIALHISVILLTVGTTIVTVKTMKVIHSGNDQPQNVQLQPGKAEYMSQNNVPNNSKNTDHETNATFIVTGQRGDQEVIYDTINSGSTSLRQFRIKECKGEKGETGGKGPMGETGGKGPVGETGPQGPMGETGDKGPMGETGDKGPIGEKGLQGSKGQPGNKGQTGDKGNIGNNGPKGEVGPVGDKGPTGDKGSHGDKGHLGDKGPSGDKGPRGEKGHIGDKGSGGEKGIKGEMGERGTTGMDGLPGINGTDGEKGQTGEKGIPGENGLQGAKGINGEPGIKGNQGLVGESGEKGTKGELGSKGLPGEKGSQGEKATERSCGSGWDLFGKYCYSFRKEKMSWQDAKMYCQRLGGNLVRIENAVENWFLKSMSKDVNYGTMWIGANDLDKEGQMVWVSDQTLVRNGFSDWLPGEPNNGGRREHCANLWDARAYKWNDGVCSLKLGFICKK